MHTALPPWESTRQPGGVCTMSEKVTIKVERKTLHLPTIALRGLVVFPNNLVHF